MKLYPTEIAAKTFDRKMMGFDPDQVENFLVTLAAQMESIIQDNTILKETLKAKELDLLQYKNRDQLLQQTMTQATQMAEKMRSESERESKLILNDAYQKAEMITADAKNSLKKIYNEIAELRKSKMQFEANLKAMAQAHLSLLEQTEQFMPRMSFPQIDME